jgi:hypothetical protein
MAWSTLNTQLYNLISDNKDSLGIYEVHRNAKLNFNGYPACSIFKSPFPAEYETNAENLRRYAFKVRLFNLRKENDLSNSIEGLEDPVDGVMNLLDQDAYNRTDKVIGINLSSRETYIQTLAVPGEWGQLLTEGLIFATLTVTIKVSVDIT